ncbi:MAG TPA: HTTM domain-containing protein [Planctomycetaceae bacterium]|jgi:hypothetical protein
MGVVINTSPIPSNTVQSNTAPSHTVPSKGFFFAREIPFGMALVRISLPLVILVDIVRRWPFARELYSTDGAIASLSSNFGNPDLLPEFSGPVAVGLFTILGLLLVTSAVGWCTRLSLLGVTVLYFYFAMLDCLSTVTKYTVIANHVFLLLAVSNCGNLWSVDAWLKRRKTEKEGLPAPDLRCDIWPQRLGQILFGMIYFGASVTKMHTDGFFSGDQLVYWMMTYLNNEHPLGDHLTRYPLIVSITCYVTFLWEVVFIFTVFQPKLRWWVLGIGTIFHFMTAFTLGLIVFPIVITASYLMFLDEHDFRTVFTWPLFRRFARFIPGSAANATATSPAIEPARLAFPARTWQLRSAGAFALTVVAVSLVGVEAEHLMDPYKMRGPDGPLPLAVMAEDDVQRLMTPDRPIRQSDKLLAFDLGGTLVGEHLASHRKEFRMGEQIVGQVTLSPPHGDMWLDCSCCESKFDGNGDLVPGRILCKVGHVMTRESFRSNFFFRLDETLDPGTYFLKLNSGNEEVARKKFTMLPAVSAAAAN